MSGCIIKAIEYYLPPGTLTNEQLAAKFPEWGVEKIASKTGISTRHIAAETELSSDLAFGAVTKLFQSGICRAEEIDFLLLCTQTPDHILPTSACLLQHRLGLPTSCGSLDFNLGCSGYIYGLGLAKGLIETGQARNVLLVTAETYSKLLDPADKTVRTLFGDGAAATLLVASAEAGNEVGPFVYGTDGVGGPNLICHRGGFRRLENAGGALWMNGPEIFNFTIKVVPDCVERVLALAEKKLGEIDLFVFHQANRYMLEHLRKKLGVSEDRFFMAMEHSGNTVSSTIPIALKEALAQGRLKPGMLVMLVGFGVGYSWGGTLVRWA
jgi:3-oxoacyl-[acyl-carrier-protein] synthase-3